MPVFDHEPSGYDLRLCYYSFSLAIKHGKYKPSQILEKLNSKCLHPEEKRVISQAFSDFASPELKIRVNQVNQLLAQLKEIDNP